MGLPFKLRTTLALHTANSTTHTGSPYWFLFHCISHVSAGDYASLFGLKEKWDHLWQVHHGGLRRGFVPDLAAWQSATLLALCFHPKHLCYPGFWAHAHEQTQQSLRSEDYTEKSSDKFKWPEEISIHLGPVSSEPAVRERRRERSKGAHPRYDRCIRDESTAVNFVCLRVCGRASVFILQHLCGKNTEKSTSQVVGAVHCVLE